MTATGSKVFYRNFNKRLSTIVRGKGIYLYDDEGRKYLDACSGSVSANLGHGNEEIAKTMGEQAATLAYTHMHSFGNEPAEQLARRVVEYSGQDYEAVYFVSGGSEATDTAIKLARQYYLERDGRSCKHKVISRWMSFHGNTIGAMSVSGKRGLRQKYDPYLFDSPHIEAPYCYRCPYGCGYPECGLRCAWELENCILREGPENVSAFMAEPIGGTSLSALRPPDDYYRVIREICDRYDVLLIFDEVMTGFARTGRHFAMEYFRVVPDILTFAKGVSSCYFPLGGVMVCGKVVEAIKKGSGRFTHGYTYSGNPLACTVGNKVVEIIQRERIAENAAKQGAYIKGRLAEMAKELPVIGDVRGEGLLVGVEFVADPATKRPFPAEAGFNAKLEHAGMKLGLALYPGGYSVNETSGDHRIISPPLNITSTECQLLMDLFQQALAQVCHELLG